jgi:membrane peptidoglycan carboxypeptidase
MRRHRRARWAAVHRGAAWVRRLPAAVRFRTIVRWTARGLLAVMLAGLAAGSSYFQSVPLPDEPAYPLASEIYFSDGRTLLARLGTVDRTETSLDQIPVPVQHAVLAAEDRGYYQHFGLSVRGVLRAAWTNATAGGGEGASTITQQYARNAYLSQDRTLSRKAKEAVLAIRLEHRYGKDEILRRYLTTIYFGRLAYGISAASWAYFGVPPQGLTLAQGAVLAAVIKDPWGFDPTVHPVQARNRWAWIIASMREQGWVSAAEAAAATYPVVLPEPPVATTQAGVNGLIVSAVERELRDHGITPESLRTAGLRVVTTVDARAQNAVLRAVAKHRTGLDPAVHTAVVAVDPATGGVLAYYGGDRGAGYFDDAIAPRPPASTFKPLTLAVGLLRGVSYESRWDGSSPRMFRLRDGVPLHNADDVQRFPCTLSEAMVLSLNTPFYSLAQEVGGATIRELAVAMGIPDSYDGRPSMRDGKRDPRPGSTRPDITLGIYPVAPADLATVYATFAARGVWSERHFVTTVQRGQEAWYTARTRRMAILPAAVTADVTTVLAGVVDKHGQPKGRRAAGKTGTQQWGNTRDNQDAWMAGYTPQMATVVWLGRPDPGPIRDTRGRPIAGDGRPFDIWRDVIANALAGQANLPFPPPAHLGDPHVGDMDVITSYPPGLWEPQLPIPVG